MSVPEVTTVGRVSALFRYPVKSMAGESVPRATIDTEGMRGDRQWAVVERGERGQILSAKRAPALMQCQAWYPEPAEGHDAHAHEQGREPSIGAVRVRVADSADSLAGDDPALRSALGAALGRDDGVKVVVLTGSGEKAFCAGADMLETSGIEKPEDDDDRISAFASASARN